MQGLGVIWSADTSPTWAFRSVPIDITSVGVWSGRVLSFEVYGSSNFPLGSMFGVDNITLVPCTDCAATGRGLKTLSIYIRMQYISAINAVNVFTCMYSLH